MWLRQRTAPCVTPELLDQCIAFHYGKELTYDMVLDVLGAVDTEVFSRLLRAVLERSVTDCIGILEEIVMQGRELSQFVSDFTWYLRNLLLIKTSEDNAIEDVVDVSSDNLVRLKEEAQMAETDASCAISGSFPSFPEEYAMPARNGF